MKPVAIAWASIVVLSALYTQRLFSTQRAVVSCQSSTLGDISVSIGIPQKHKVDATLQRQGYALFRGLPVPTAEDFAAYTPEILGSIHDYTKTGTENRNVVKAVSRIPDEPKYRGLIPQHTEMGYNIELPTRLAFACSKPAEKGGTTPISNVVNIAAQIPEEMKQRLLKEGIRYHRSFSDKTNFDESTYYKHWQDQFNVTTKHECEQRLQTSDFNYRFEWVIISDKPQLHLSYIMSAFLEHPHLQKLSFANNLITHATYFDVIQEYESLSSFELPLFCQWGNGEDFSEADLFVIEELYKKNTLEFEWEAGDVLVVDNLWWSHGRRKIEGKGERKMFSMLGDMTARVEDKMKVL